MTAGITSSTFTKSKWRIWGYGDQLEIYDSGSCYITAGISSNAIQGQNQQRIFFRWYMAARITVITCEWRIRGYADLLRTYDLLMREHGDNIMRTNGLPCKSFSHVEEDGTGPPTPWSITGRSWSPAPSWYWLTEACRHGANWPAGDGDNFPILDLILMFSICMWKELYPQLP